jgi:hypothetical protein
LADVVNEHGQPLIGGGAFDPNAPDKRSAHRIFDEAKDVFDAATMV